MPSEPADAGADPAPPATQPRRRLTRRAFLRGLLGAVAITGVTGFAAGKWSSRVKRGPRRWLHFFSEGEFEIMTAVAEVMLPAGFDELETVERIDDTLAALPKHETADLGTLLWSLEYLPAVLGPKLGFFTALSDSARADYLRGWERSRYDFKRTGHAVLKYLLMVHYYGDPRSWKAIRYVPMTLTPQVP